MNWKIVEWLFSNVYSNVTNQKNLKIDVHHLVYRFQYDYYFCKKYKNKTTTSKDSYLLEKNLLFTAFLLFCFLIPLKLNFSSYFQDVVRIIVFHWISYIKNIIITGIFKHQTNKYIVLIICKLEILIKHKTSVNKFKTCILHAYVFLHNPSSYGLKTGIKWHQSKNLIDILLQ